MHSLFLSHSSKDKEFARKLANSLNSIGVKVWIDEAEIKVGDLLIEKIQDGIDNVDYVGVVLSPDSVESTWVKKELEVAMNQEILNKKVKVIPILITECKIPSFLIGKKYADFSKNFMSGFNELVYRLTPNTFIGSNNLGKSNMIENIKSLYISENYNFDLQSIVGMYQVVGTNPNGGNYIGVAEIAYTNDKITISTIIGHKTFLCAGHLNNNKLKVSGDFNVIYSVLPNGLLVVVWEDEGSETLIPHKLIGNIPFRN